MGLYGAAIVAVGIGLTQMAGAGKAAKEAIARWEAQIGKPTTHNFVVFDDKLIRITHKNGQEVGLMERDGPTAVEFDVPEGETPYRAGVALGVRDAVASIAEKAGTEPSIDDWFDDALRRR